MGILTCLNAVDLGDIYRKLEVIDNSLGVIDAGLGNIEINTI